jgi:hypothetical protein
MLKYVVAESLMNLLFFHLSNFIKTIFHPRDGVKSRTTFWGFEVGGYGVHFAR